MDPADKVDFIVDSTPLLQEGEGVGSIDLAVLAESALLGFKIETDSPYEPVEISPGVLRVWASVEVGNQNAAGWAAGIECGIEFTVVTNSTPERHFQRTVAVKVIQK